MFINKFLIVISKLFALNIKNFDLILKYCSIWLLFLHYCPICMSYIFVKCCGEVLRFPCHHCLSKATSVEVEKIFKDFQHNITRTTTQGPFMYEPQRTKNTSHIRNATVCHFVFFFLVTCTGWSRSSEVW